MPVPKVQQTSIQPVCPVVRCTCQATAMIADSASPITAASKASWSRLMSRVPSDTGMRRLRNHIRISGCSKRPIMPFSLRSPCMATRQMQSSAESIMIS